MDYITITTPENIEIEYRLAGLGSRLAAVFIDVLIQTLGIIAIYAVILFGVMHLDFNNLNNIDIYGIGPALLVISAFVIYLGYYAAFEFAMKGQTPGKKLFRLRVIRNNGQPIAFSHSIVRNILRYFVDFTGIGAVCVLLNKQHKRVGDMAASTIVVAENPDIDIIHLNNVFEYRIDTYQNLRLDDDEYNLLIGFWERRNEFLDNGVGMRRHIARYLARKFETSEYVITDELLFQVIRMNRR